MRNTFHAAHALRVDVTVHLDDATAPATGWLEDPAGTRRPFVGMIELLALLERCRVDDRPVTEGDQ
jgi:hypothetical protein